MTTRSMCPYFHILSPMQASSLYAIGPCVCFLFPITPYVIEATCEYPPQPKNEPLLPCHMPIITSPIRLTRRHRSVRDRRLTAHYHQTVRVCGVADPLFKPRARTMTLFPNLIYDEVAGGWSGPWWFCC